VGSIPHVVRAVALTRRPRWVDVVAALVCIIGLVGGGACGQRDDDRTAVVGVLPDGTRYELSLPSGLEIGEVQEVDVVPVWADGTDGLLGAVGVTSFYRTDAYGWPEPSPTAPPLGRASVVDGRLTVRAGMWAMQIDLYDYSIGYEAELEQIEARAQDGLIVIDLPPSLRFPEPNELPRQIEVVYAKLRVVRGCSEEGRCSPDGQIMVTPIMRVPPDVDTIDVSAVGVRVVGN
jgi:hypothetical protein